jgi:hypothetical protein
VTIPPPAPQCTHAGAGGGNLRGRLPDAEQYSVRLGAAVKFGRLSALKGLWDTPIELNLTEESPNAESGVPRWGSLYTLSPSGFGTLQTCRDPG